MRILLPQTVAEVPDPQFLTFGFYRSNGMSKIARLNVIEYVMLKTALDRSREMSRSRLDPVFVYTDIPCGL